MSALGGPATIAASWLPQLPHNQEKLLFFVLTALRGFALGMRPLSRGDVDNGPQLVTPTASSAATRFDELVGHAPRGARLFRPCLAAFGL
eukprot:1788025-Pyramimonas_sp.AAC.1